MWCENGLVPTFSAQQCTSSSGQAQPIAIPVKSSPAPAQPIFSILLNTKFHFRCSPGRKWGKARDWNSSEEIEHPPHHYPTTFLFQFSLLILILILLLLLTITKYNQITNATTMHDITCRSNQNKVSSYPDCSN